MGGWAFYWLNNCGYQLNYLIHMFPVGAGEAVYDCYAAGRSLALLVNGYKGERGKAPPGSFDQHACVTPNGYIATCVFVEKLNGAN